MFTTKEPLFKTKEKYDNIAKRHAFTISDRQKDARDIQLQINDLTIKLEELSGEIKELQTEMLEAQAKAQAVQELIDNNDLFM